VFSEQLCLSVCLSVSHYLTYWCQPLCLAARSQLTRDPALQHALWASSRPVRHTECSVQKMLFVILNWYHVIWQDKTRQDKARQDKTRQDKTRQNIIVHNSMWDNIYHQQYHHELIWHRCMPCHAAMVLTLSVWLASAPPSSSAVTACVWPWTAA
jgi:hypothetical protein